jgi:hypothetical protein
MVRESGKDLVRCPNFSAKEGEMSERMESCGRSDSHARRDVQRCATDGAVGGTRAGREVESAAGGELAHFPERVRASVAHKAGEYDARRLRSQREVIRDVMLSAAECDTWLTLGELRALTRYGEASISAQLRHLRKAEYGGYDVIKRHRDGPAPERRTADARGECVWEYRLRRGADGEAARAEGVVALDAVA